jgi:hypothetical protein
MVSSGAAIPTTRTEGNSTISSPYELCDPQNILVLILTGKYS